MKEEWKDIKGFEGLYQVSNLGKVKSLYRYKKVLSGRVSNFGYVQVNLRKNGTSLMSAIHRLVAQAFIDNPSNYPQVDHIDGCRTNNHVNNLRWCTQKQNLNFSLARKNISIAQKKVAMNSHKYPKRTLCIPKKVNQYDLDGMFVKSWDSMTDVSRFYNISIQSIMRAIENKWASVGYLWTNYTNSRKPIPKHNDKRRKRILVKDVFGSEELFHSIGEASLRYNLSRRSILNYVDGKCKNRDGLIFKILQNEI